MPHKLYPIPDLVCNTNVLDRHEASIRKDRRSLSNATESSGFPTLPIKSSLRPAHTLSGSDVDVFTVAEGLQDAVLPSSPGGEASLDRTVVRHGEGSHKQRAHELLEVLRAHVHASQELVDRRLLGLSVVLSFCVREVVTR